MIKEKAKRVTIKDVAKVAGLSFATVSRVLNDNPGFPEQTRKKVWDAANSLNYTPNRQARVLRSGDTGSERAKSSIILHISHLPHEEPFESEFESRRLALVARKSIQTGLYTIPFWYNEENGFQCPPVLNGYVDGTLVGTPHLEVVNVLRTKKIPMVLMDVPFSSEHSDIPMVNLNFKTGFLKLFNHLKELGHKKIATVSPKHQDNSAIQDALRIENIWHTAELAGFKVDREASAMEVITPETHDIAMTEIAQRLGTSIKNGNISAIITPAHTYAETLVEKFDEMNIRIPEDVSITSVYSELETTPQYGITSIVYDWPNLIDTALEVLKSLINGNELSCREYLIEPDFYIGKTTAKTRI